MICVLFGHEYFTEVVRCSVLIIKFDQLFMFITNVLKETIEALSQMKYSLCQKRSQKHEDD